jgi:hypothetical protein
MWIISNEDEVTTESLDPDCLPQSFSALKNQIVGVITH